MKRFIAVLSFAVAVPAAMAAGAPFEQTEFDRALPQLSGNASTGPTRERAERGLPFEQTELDRAPAAVAGKARSASATSQPWVDYNFIAPAL